MRAPLGLVLFLLLLLAACQERRPDYPQRTPPADLLQKTSRQAGRALFLRHCAVCHGYSGEGRHPRSSASYPPAPDFSERRYRSLDPAYLYWRIQVGKTVEPFRSQGSVMPAWGPHLSAEEIWQLVGYLQSDR